MLSFLAKPWLFSIVLAFALLAPDRAAADDGFSHHRRVDRIVVFGDSLSDVGTYKVGAIAEVGGGKFTTNPGPVWTETIGLLLGARVTPFRQGFAGTSVGTGGTGFAMGGARVSQQPGIDCNPDATGNCTAALTIPVRQQITDYLAANNDRFTRDQLVFLLAGANDILFQLGVFQAKVAIGMPVEQATNEALAAVRQAALELVGEVQRILGKGATRVVVLNVPDISDTPFGKAPTTAPVRSLIAGMVPVALGGGEGGDFRAPLGIAVIGGVITSTVLTLLVIPTGYEILADLQDWVSKRVRGRAERESRHAAPTARPVTES